MVIGNYIILKSIMSLFKCAARTGLKRACKMSLLVVPRLQAPTAVVGSN
jgi:hypothetical protein